MRVSSQEELTVCKRLKSLDAVKGFIPMKREGMPEIQVKPIVILVAHMYGLFNEGEMEVGKIRENLDSILKTMPSLMEILLEQTLMLSQMFRAGRSPRRILAKNVLTIIQFQQNLMTGGWIDKDPFLQLPGFGMDECQRYKQGNPKTTLYGYSTMSREQRLEMAPSIFGLKPDSAELKAKFEQQELFIETLPLVKLTMTAEVEGEDEICVGDVLTCKLRVDYLNLAPGEKSGYVASKHYPFLKRDSWHLIITDEQLLGLAAVEKINVTDNFYEKEFKERIQRPGKIAFTAILTNDSYRGLDQFRKVEVNVLAKPTHRDEIEYTKYDLREIRAQNGVQAALMGEEDNDTDEDEAEAANEEDELRRKLASAGLGGCCGGGPKGFSAIDTSVTTEEKSRPDDMD